MRLDATMRRLLLLLPPIGLAALALGGCSSGPNLGDSDASEDELLDPQLLDRDAATGACGFPSPGPNGYGTEVGERLADSTGFTLITCEGEQLSLSDFFCQREDEYGDFNRGILLNIGAGWCGPCQEETREFPALYEEFHDRGIEIIQILFQDWSAQAPTRSFCTDWKTGQWRGDEGETVDINLNLEFPVLLDQVTDWAFQYLQDPASATPVNILLDANGNIRWKLEGEKPEESTLRAQFELVISEPYAPPQ